jgi:hypothetical protein
MTYEQEIVISKLFLASSAVCIMKTLSTKVSVTFDDKEDYTRHSEMKSKALIQ